LTIARPEPAIATPTDPSTSVEAGRSRPEAAEDSTALKTHPDILEPERIVWPVFILSADNRYHVQDFLLLHDRAFVTAAYGAVLRREPNPVELEGNLDRLRRGVSKAEILAGLQYSAEGRLAGTRVSGLGLPHATQKLGQWPVIGPWMRRLAAIWFLPDTERERRAFENTLTAYVVQEQSASSGSLRKIGQTLRQLSEDQIATRQTAAAKADRAALEGIHAELDVLKSKILGVEAITERKADKNEMDPVLESIRGLLHILQSDKADRIELMGMNSVKADKSELVHIDAVKADRVELDEIGSRKADKADTAQLQLVKADRAELEEVRTNKADKVEMARLQSLKADKADTAQLQLVKADRVELEEVRSNKADKVEIAHLQSVKADKADSAQLEQVKADRAELEEVRSNKADKVEIAQLQSLKADKADTAQLQLVKADRAELEEVRTNKADKVEIAQLQALKADKATLDEILLAVGDLRRAQGDLREMSEEFIRALEAKSDRREFAALTSSLIRLAQAQVSKDDLAALEQSIREIVDQRVKKIENAARNSA
jgi:hypothetical protein